MNKKEDWNGLRGSFHWIHDSQNMLCNPTSLTSEPRGLTHDFQDLVDLDSDRGASELKGNTKGYRLFWQSYFVLSGSCWLTWITFPRKTVERLQVQALNFPSTEDAVQWYQNIINGTWYRCERARNITKNWFRGKSNANIGNGLVTRLVPTWLEAG